MAVCLLGLGNLIFLKELVHRRHVADKEERVNLPEWLVSLFVVVSLLWFVALLVCNFRKGVL